MAGSGASLALGTGSASGPATPSRCQETEAFGTGDDKRRPYDFNHANPTGIFSCEGQCDLGNGPAAVAAVQPDPPAVCLAELRHDGETQAASARRTATRTL